MSNENDCSEKIEEFLRQRKFRNALDFLKKHKKNISQIVFGVFAQHCFREFINAREIFLAAEVNKIIEKIGGKMFADNKSELEKINQKTGRKENV